MQNVGHIKALRELSEQFAHLPIYNIVLFAGDCKLKNVTYWSDYTFVGYTGNISYVLKKLKDHHLARYTDKREVARLLRQAVKNGSNPDIVANHIASVKRKAVSQRQYEAGMNLSCIFSVLLCRMMILSIWPTSL